MNPGSFPTFFRVTESSGNRDGGPTSRDAGLNDGASALRGGQQFDSLQALSGSRPSLQGAQGKAGQSGGTGTVGAPRLAGQLPAAGLSLAEVQNSQAEGLPFQAGMEAAEFRRGLASWFNEAPPDEWAARAKAIELINVAMVQLKSPGTRVRLSLGNLGLSTVPPLPPGIDELDLSNNRLTSLDGLSGLTTLRKLRACGNRLSTVEGLQDLKALKDLNLSSNAIQSINEFPKLEKLKYLNLGGNSIESIDPDKLVFLPRLDNVNLAGNDLSPRTHENLMKCELFVGTAYVGFDRREVNVVPPDSGKPGAVDAEIGRCFRGDAIRNERYLRWGQFASEPGAAQFATLLRRVNESAALSGGQRITERVDLKKIIDLAEQDPVFRAHCFQLSSRTGVDVVENALGTFRELVLHRENPAYQAAPSVEKTVQYYRGTLFEQLVNEFDATHFAGGDAEDRRLLLRKKFSPKVDVPEAAPDRHRVPAGGLDARTIVNAERYLRHGMSENNVVVHLCRDGGWKRILNNHFEGVLAQFGRQWQGLRETGHRLERTFRYEEEDWLAAHYRNLGNDFALPANQAARLAGQLPRGGSGSAFAALEYAARRDLEFGLTHRLLDTVRWQRAAAQVPFPA